MVGFLAIVAALRAGQGRQSTDRERIHTTILLVSSVMVLLPSWLLSFRGGTERIWTWLLGTLLAAHLVGWAVFVPQLGEGAVLREFPATERNALVFLIVLGAIAVGTEVWS